MKRKMMSEVISIDHGSSLEVKFSATDTSYNTGWDWLMHPPPPEDGRETIGDCYGLAWGELKNGKKHGLTYLAHYSFQEGKCWHRRAQDKLVWTDGVYVSDNNWVCCARYVHGKLAASPNQYRIHLDANEESESLTFGTLVAFNTSPPDPAISVRAQWHAGGDGIPAIIDVKE